MSGWDSLSFSLCSDFCDYLKKMSRAGCDPSHSITLTARLIMTITSIYTLSAGEAISELEWATAPSKTGANWVVWIKNMETTVGGQAGFFGWRIWKCCHMEDNSPTEWKKPKIVWITGYHQLFFVRWTKEEQKHWLGVSVWSKIFTKTTWKHGALTSVSR